MLRVFPGMTVLENLLIGHHGLIRYGPRPPSSAPAHVWAEERRVKDEMMELLSFDRPRRLRRACRRASCRAASAGCWRSGRAIAMRPKLLMLDEPAAGLSPVNVDKLLDTVLALKERLRPDA